MKVLFIASEAHPFMKTGGLADVAYALPKALRGLSIDARVILPNYGQIQDKYKEKMELLSEFDVPVGWRNQYCGLKYLELDSIPFYFIDNEYYFNRTGAYGFYDDGERFSFFSRGVLEAINHLGDFKPDVIHCNDWHTAIIPLLLKHHYSHFDSFRNIKTVFTIHNLRYQGVFGEDVLTELLCLNKGYYSEDKLKFFDGISFMKGGIIYSDALTTVSNSYADEIQTSYFGEGLEGLITSNNYKLSGIVNGLDYDLFNPALDEDIYKNFDVNSLNNKETNKLELQKSLNLTVNKDIPIISLVTRLVDQKGLDLVACIFEDLLKQDVQIIALGTGDRKYEDLFKFFAWKYPNKVSANIFFDNNLAKKIYASSDIFLMPSQFEPCGIGQLIALRYGTLPLVRETGGLKDTVSSYNEITGTGNGFSFSEYNAHDMLYTLNRAIDIYKNHRKMWTSIMETAMASDNSWFNSAVQYSNLYNNLF